MGSTTPPRLSISAINCSLSLRRISPYLAASSRTRPSLLPCPSIPGVNSASLSYCSRIFSLRFCSDCIWFAFFCSSLSPAFRERGSEPSADDGESTPFESSGKCPLLGALVCPLVLPFFLPLRRVAGSGDSVSLIRSVQMTSEPHCSHRNTLSPNTSLSSIVPADGVKARMLTSTIRTVLSAYSVRSS